MTEVEVTIAGRHVEVTEPMAEHIRQRIDRLPRLDDKIQYLTVTLAVDSGSQLVEIIAKCRRTDMVAEAASHDMYQSIDEAFEKMERQVARLHDKAVSNRSRAAQQASEANRRPE